MQVISSRFNRFYHKCVLTDLFNKSNKLVFTYLKDETTGGAFTIYKYEDYHDMEDLKQLLKVLNLDYRVKDNENVSTCDITSKELSEHIEYCFKLAADNGIDLDVIREEWERMIRGAY